MHLRNPCHCEEAAGRRGNLKSPPEGKFRVNDTSQRLPRLLRSLAMTSLKVSPPTASLRGAKRRGNLKAATDRKLRMNDTSQRLPRPRWGLAMTDVVDGLRLGFDFPMSLRGGEADVAIRPLNASLRGPSGPWQSQGTNGREISAERYFPEIATAPMGPRNDRCGR